MLSDFIKFQQPPHIGNQGLKEIEPDIKPAKLELRRESIGFFDMLKPKMKTTPIKEIELPIVNDGIIDAKMQSNKINNLDEQVFGSKLPKPILTRDKPEVHLYHMDKKSNLDIQRENAINEQKYGQAENLPEDEQKLNEMENDVNEMEQLMREKIGHKKLNTILKNKSQKMKIAEQITGTPISQKRDVLKIKPVVTPVSPKRKIQETDSEDEDESHIRSILEQVIQEESGEKKKKRIPKKVSIQSSESESVPESPQKIKKKTTPQKKVKQSTLSDIDFIPKKIQKDIEQTEKTPLQKKRAESRQREAMLTDPGLNPPIPITTEQLNELHDTIDSVIKNEAGDNKKGIMTKEERDKINILLGKMGKTSLRIGSKTTYKSFIEKTLPLIEMLAIDTPFKKKEKTPKKQSEESDVPPLEMYAK